MEIWFLEKNTLNVLQVIPSIVYLIENIAAQKNIFCIAIKATIITIIIKKHDNQAGHCERTPWGRLCSVMVILCCKGLAHWVGKVLYKNILFSSLIIKTLLQITLNKDSDMSILQYFSELLNHLCLRVAVLAKWVEEERSSQQCGKIQKTFELRYNVK